MSKEKAALCARMFCALVTAMSLFLDYSGLGIAQMLRMGGVQGAALTAGLFLLYSWIDGRRRRLGGSGAAGIWLGLLFSACLLLGDVMRQEAGFAYLTSAKSHLLAACIALLGRGILLREGLDLLWGAMRSPGNSLPERQDGALAALFPERSGMLRLMCVMLICWLPYLLGNLPGNLGPDSYEQYRQFKGMESYTAQVSQFPEGSVTKLNTMIPVPHTLLVSGILSLFAVGEDVTLGVLVFCVLQAVALSAVLAKSLLLMRDLGAGRRGRLAALGVYCISPLFPLYAFSTAKDTLFTILFLWVLISLIELVLTAGECLKRPGWLAGACASATMFLLFRGGAWAIWLASLPFISGIVSWKRKGLRAPMAALMVVPLVVWLMTTQALYPALGIGKGPNRENISVMFQQTARYVTRYGDEVTADERDAINGVMQYEGLSERYMPEIADMVKNYVREDADRAAWKAYYKTWLEQMKKHPGCYAEAAALLWYEYMDANAAFVDYGQRYYYGQGANSLNLQFNRDVVKEIQVRRPSYAPRMEKIVRAGLRLMSGLPVINLLFNIGAHMWLLIACAVFLRKARARGACVFAPLLLLLVGLLFTPVNGSVRYALPIIYAMPMMLCFAASRLRSSAAHGACGA